MTTVQQITGDMTIGEMVQKFPSVAEVLQNEGVHCVGCGAAFYETIHDGLAGHGKTQEEIDTILIRLNDSIPKEEGNEDLTITDLAATKLKEILTEKQKIALRIKVMEGGCAGLSYDFSLTDEQNDEDVSHEISGVKIFLDSTSKDKLKGAKVDYIDSLTGAGFKITNPNAKSTCGCGSSFN
jgi:iron-sulfur cluster assembly protein